MNFIIWSIRIFITTKIALNLITGKIWKRNYLIMYFLSINKSINILTEEHFFISFHKSFVKVIPILCLDEIQWPNSTCKTISFLFIDNVYIWVKLIEDFSMDIDEHCLTQNIMKISMISSVPDIRTQNCVFYNVFQSRRILLYFH
jgi:hypothetical protein